VLAQIQVLPDEEVEFVDDKGLTKTRIVHPVKLRFELVQEDANGRRLTVSSKMNLSRSDKSRLFKFLKGWKVDEFFTNPFFDLETLVGKCALVTISHDTNNGKTYANIVSCLPLNPAKQSPIQVRDFVPF
jgi:hypothetical protein